MLRRKTFYPGVIESIPTIFVPNFLRAMENLCVSDFLEETWRLGHVSGIGHNDLLVGLRFWLS